MYSRRQQTNGKKNAMKRNLKIGGPRSKPTSLGHVEIASHDSRLHINRSRLASRIYLRHGYGLTHRCTSAFEKESRSSWSGDRRDETVQNVGMLPCTADAPFLCDLCRGPRNRLGAICSLTLSRSIPNSLTVPSLHSIAPTSAGGATPADHRLPSLHVEGNVQH